MRRWFIAAFVISAVAALSRAAGPQQRAAGPRIGYAYPAGGAAGTTFQITVGGQALAAADRVRITGEGVKATVLGYDRPLSQRQVTLLRDRLEEARKKLAESGNPFAGGRGLGAMARLAKEAGITDVEVRKLLEFQRARADPRRQPNPQIEEKVTLQVEIDAQAAPGPRDLRLLSPIAATNPLRFEISALPEVRETEPNDGGAVSGETHALPAIFNGQISPGDIDRFTFSALKGQAITISVRARDLIPYLADAVPGWFQATIALFGPDGREVAYADDDDFRPDPILRYVPNADGPHTLEIRDSIFRGREDFVYRISVADTLPAAPAVSIAGDIEEREPNNGMAQAQRTALPAILGGCIGGPGDRDVYAVRGSPGSAILAEVMARRIGSPMDSALTALDSRGRRLAFNDDSEDRAEGLVTHHADSRLMASIPPDGVLFLFVAETQQKGGADYRYRLRVGPPQPDFQLRVTPSAVSARGGTTAVVSVHVLRRDGFAGQISLSLIGAPPGFSLPPSVIPAGQNSTQVGIRVPAIGRLEPFPLRIQGSVRIEGVDVTRDAVPAEDMMQAFAYRHLVPCREFLVSVFGRAPSAPNLRRPAVPRRGRAQR
jgi:hypothetical protein